MSTVDEILEQIPIESLAQRLGVDPATAESAARQALPALLGGMEANAKDPDGAASLQAALSKHTGQLVDGGVNLDDVDEADGAKIVSHVFGDNEQQVIQNLGGGLGGLGGLGDLLGGGAGGGEGTSSAAVGSIGGSSLITKLLPLLAPIVMSFLAKKMSSGAAGAQAATDEGGGIGDLLGGILGGAEGSSESGGGGLGDLLGGLFGKK